MAQPDIGILSAAERPWIRLRYRSGTVTADGQSEALLGHRLDTGGPIPDGLFCWWVWDGTRLVARNDRYGMMPLFYAETKDGVILSTSLPLVARATARTLDTPALAVFFRLGFFVGEDTPFEEVKILPPSSTLVWEAGQLSLNRGSIAFPPPPAPIRRFGDAVSAYADLFHQAMARRPARDGDATVPISGGRDSRHILLALTEAGQPPSLAVTVRSRPPSSNEDLRIARLLRDAIGFPHVEIDMPQAFASAHLKEIEVAGLCSSGHIWLLPVSAYLKDRTRTVYDGLAGDVLSAGFQFSKERQDLLRRGRVRQLAEDLLREAQGIDAFLATGLRSDLAGALTQDAAIARLAVELGRHCEADNPLLSYVFWNRTRRGISLIPCAILDHIERVYCPFLDHDLFDFLVNLDPAWTEGNRLHDETIRRAYPRYADLPYEDPAAPPITGRPVSAYYRRAAGQMLGHLGQRPSTLRSRILRTERIAMMAARDLIRPRCPPTWYVRHALYLLELESLLDA